MLAARVLTALALLAVLVPFTIWAPVRVFALGSLLVMGLCLREWLALVWKDQGPRLAALIMFGIAGGALILDGWFLPEDLLFWMVMPVTLAWLVCLPWVLWRHHSPRGVLGGLAAWLACLACFLALWLGRQQGLEFLLSILLLVWVADTAAYFAGRAFGRRKLAPAISPGKTWEGVAGALIGNWLWVVAAQQLGWTSSWPTLAAEIWGLDGLIVLTGLITLMAVMADLHQSLLKRQQGVKDSGGLLPGHGGVFDRLDALLAVIPLATVFVWPTTFF